MREARLPHSNGHTHSERSQHKCKRSRKSDYKEHSKRPRNVDESAIERIIEEKVDEEEILIEHDMTEKNSIASPKAPVLANNHHHSKHDKKSDRKSEKKQSRKRDRAVMSSVVGMVAKTSSDEAKVSSSSSSSLSHKKHRHHHHHTHKEKRKHKQKHRSSSSHKK